MQSSSAACSQALTTTHNSLLYIEPISERQSQTLNPMSNIRHSLLALDISDHAFLLQEFVANSKHTNEAISVHQAEDTEEMFDLGTTQGRNRGQGRREPALYALDRAGGMMWTAKHSL